MSHFHDKSPAARGHHLQAQVSLPYGKLWWRLRADCQRVGIRQLAERGPAAQTCSYWAEKGYSGKCLQKRVATCKQAK